MQTPGQLDLHRSSHPCELWEALIPDALDGTLSDAEQQALDRHVAGCVHCADEFAHAQRGAAWLGMLKTHAPEPAGDLVARVLAATTGGQAVASAAALPVFVPEPVSEVWTRERVPEIAAKGGMFARFANMFKIENSTAGFQPRMAMTASMAFFSIALTLNLMGVNLRHISTASLRPNAISRSLADGRASMTRSFQNNRVVYQFESRVSDFRRDALPENAFPGRDTGSNTDSNDSGATPSTAPDTNSSPKHAPEKPAHGSSELVLPMQPKAAASIPTPRKEA